MGNAARNHDQPRRQALNRPQLQKKSPASKVVIAVGSIDYTTLLVVSLLLLIGIIMIFSASYYNAATHEKFNYDMFYLLKKQVIFVVMGFTMMMIMSVVNYHYLIKFCWPIYLVSNVLLIAVAIMGVASHGAVRWIILPVIGKFQPSEISKMAIILLLAFLIQKNRSILKSWRGFSFCCGLVVFTAILVLFGGLSTALIVLLIGFGIIFVASPHIMRFVVIGASSAGLLAFFLLFLAKGSFRFARVQAWLSPFDFKQGYGYQIINSLYAIATGGPFGLGIGQSRQKSFIPEPHNDFIFAIICEELGMVGAGLVLLLFGILIWRGLKIAMTATDAFGSMIATGIVFLIASQTLINVAVVTNSMPNTGVPLPFISYGGTSLIVTMFLVGILLNISRHSKE